MAFDDIEVVQYSGVISKGEGDDTYLLSAYTVEPGASIQITDTRGANKIQLINDLTVTNAMVANSALQLTLSNGAVVTVLGANSFTYELGGSPLTNTQGQNYSFAELANNVLGVNVPSIGTVTGNGFTVGDDLPDVDVGNSTNTIQTLAQAQSMTVATVSDVAAFTTEHVPTLLENDYVWSDQSITYGYPSSTPGDHLNEGYATTNGWRALTSQEQQIFDGIVASQNKFVNADLQKSVNGSSVDIRVAAVNQDANTEAFAYYPGNGIGGDVFLNAAGEQGDSRYFAENGFALTAMAHELGHAMALKHPFEESPTLPSALDNLAYTIMSYSDSATMIVEASTYQDSGSGWSVETTGAYRSELGIYDVAALQAGYGADMQTNATNTIYTYDESQRKFEGSDGVYSTIWDAGGVDTLDCSDAVYVCEIDLNDYTLSSISRRTTSEEAVLVAQAGDVSSQYYDDIESFIVNDLGDYAFLNENNLGITYGTVIENVMTGQGNDTVTDNQVDNEIDTGAGDDIIMLGSGGYDVVNGGLGSDTVRLAIASTEVETFENETGFYLAGSHFGAQLIGIESIEYTDQTYIV